MKNLVALEMLSVILGEGTNSRLYVNLVENLDEQIFNMIDAENKSMAIVETNLDEKLHDFHAFLADKFED